MPTLAQMEAAAPKCPVEPAGSPGGRKGPRCCSPCTYDAGANVWRCPTHGDVLAGEVLGAIANGLMTFTDEAA